MTHSVAARPPVPRALSAPFPYFGGKRRVAHLIWERFGPDVSNYVEPFFGSGAVLLGRPSEPRIETVNDKDCLLANFWRATQADPEAVARWADWPINEADLHARHRWLVSEGVRRLRSDPDFYDAQIAGWWVWGICQWIGGDWCRGAERRSGSPRMDLHSAGIGLHGRGAFAQIEERRPVLSCANGVHLPLRQPNRGHGRGVLDAVVSEPLPNLNQHHGRGAFAQTEGSCAEHTGQLVAVFERLRDRLRRVRICCGDWTRVLGPTPTHLIGTTAVFLDPPYSHAERDTEIYRVEEDIAPAVRDWAIANGDNRKLRIALCGYESEHEMPASWSVVRWKAHGGYGGQKRGGRGAANRHRERIWFSPHCLSPARYQIPLFADEAAE